MGRCVPLYIIVRSEIKDFEANQSTDLHRGSRIITGLLLNLLFGDTMQFFVVWVSLHHSKILISNLQWGDIRIVTASMHSESQYLGTPQYLSQSEY